MIQKCGKDILADELSYHLKENTKQCSSDTINTCELIT